MVVSFARCEGGALLEPLGQWNLIFERHFQQEEELFGDQEAIHNYIFILKFEGGRGCVVERKNPAMKILAKVSHSRGLEGGKGDTGTSHKLHVLLSVCVSLYLEK